MIHNFFFFFSPSDALFTCRWNAAPTRAIRGRAAPNPSHTPCRYSRSQGAGEIIRWTTEWRLEGFSCRVLFDNLENRTSSRWYNSVLCFFTLLSEKKNNTLSVTHYSTVQIPLRNPRSRHWICFCESQTLKKPRGWCDVAGVTAGIQESGNKTLIPLDMSEFILF